jgi:hypothetical protein
MNCGYTENLLLTILQASRIFMPPAKILDSNLPLLYSYFKIKVAKHTCSPSTQNFSQAPQTVLPVVPLMQMPLQYKLVQSVIMWTLSPINPLYFLGRLPPKNTGKTCCFGFVFGFCKSLSHTTGRFMYPSHPISYTCQITRSLLYLQDFNVQIKQF